MRARKQGNTMMQVSVMQFMIVLVLTGVLQSCASERGVEPVPEKYRLYVAMNATSPAFEAYILGIDCETDSVVDSLFQTAWKTFWGEIFASPDPGVIVVPHEGVHRLLDTRSNIFGASLQSEFEQITFLHETGRLLGQRADSLVVFEDTTYTVRQIYHQEFRNGKRISKTSRVIGKARVDPTGGPPYGPLIIYDVATNETVDSFIVDTRGDGRGFAFYQFDISPDGTRIYGSGEVGGEAWILGFDLTTKQVLWMYPQVGHSSHGWCFVSPNGGEVWVTWLANPFMSPWPQSVYILNASTGALIDTIDASGTTLGWPRAVSPTLVSFVPGEDKAYISCGTAFTGRQPVLVVSMNTREISRVLFGNADRIPSRMAIGLAP